MNTHSWPPKIEIGLCETTTLPASSSTCRNWRTSPQINPLSLHDALPIFAADHEERAFLARGGQRVEHAWRDFGIRAVVEGERDRIALTRSAREIGRAHV